MPAQFDEWQLKNKEYGDHRRNEHVVIRVMPDENSESPREWGNVGTFAMYHRRYDYGDKKAFENPAELKKFLKEKNCAWLPVYMLDHSGLHFSTGSFGDPWDSGQVGVIYVTPEKIVQEYGRDDDETREMALRCMKGEIETLDMYVNGDVWGYVIEADGEQADSCWGFYGRDDCVSEALDVYDGVVTEYEEKQAKLAEEKEQAVIESVSAFATPLVNEECGSFEEAVAMLRESGVAESALEAIRLLGSVHAETMEVLNDRNVPIMESAERAVEEAARSSLAAWLGVDYVEYESPGSGRFDFSEEMREMIEVRMAEKKSADPEYSVDNEKGLNAAALYILKNCDHELDLEPEIGNGAVPTA